MPGCMERTRTLAPKAPTSFRIFSSQIPAISSTSDVIEVKAQYVIADNNLNGFVMEALTELQWDTRR
jgi:hypothetical protein